MKHDNKAASEKLDEAIYEKYIRPTQRKRKPCVGTEFELPIVNLSGKAVDFEVVHAVTDEFVRHFSFDRLSRDEDGCIYAAQSSHNDDILSYDCSYNTLELSFGAKDDIHEVDRLFRRYYTFLQSRFAGYGHTLTGMGVNPHYSVNRGEPIHNGRYRMLLHHLKSYEKYGDAIPFHHNPDFGLFSCAAQVQLDVEESTLPEVFNTFTKLEPLKSVLFANSLWGSNHELLCGRDRFWKNSLHGLNRHNVDMYDVSFSSSDELRTLTIFVHNLGHGNSIAMIIVLPLSGISLLPMPEPNSYLYILLFLNVILYNYKCHRVSTLGMLNLSALIS